MTESKTITKMDEVLEAARDLGERVDRYKAGSISRVEVEKMLDELVRKLDGERNRLPIFPTGTGAARLGAQAPLSYKSLFCRRGESLSRGGWNDFTEFVDAAMNARADERLQKSWREGVPSDGGLAVPTEFSAQIFDAMLEDQVVLPRATVYPMGSNTRKIPATVLGDHSASLYGGLVAYWKAEGTTLTQAEPKYRSIDLHAEKLTVFGKASNEWFSDVADAAGHIQRTFAKGGGWYLDQAFLRGSGAGEPLGILNSPCLVTASKGVNETADSIKYYNLGEMLSRLYPPCLKNSTFVFSPSAFSSLLTFLGEELVNEGFLRVDNNLNISLFTRPVVVSEHLNPIGDVGDVLLADFTQYAVGMRENMRLELSRDRYFESDETAQRLILRGDGMPLWDEPVTLRDGSTTQSPFVVLEAR